MFIRRSAGLVEQERTQAVIGAFFDVYNALGFGFLESVYGNAMEHEIRERGLQVQREVGVRVVYKGQEIARQRLDMLVAGSVIVEIKATSKIHASAAHQVYNYLRATQLRVGLVLHFGLKPKFLRIYAAQSQSAPYP